MSNSKNKTLVIILSLLLLFGLPLGIASWMVNHHSFKSFATTHHGRLIDPPLDFTQLVEATAWKGRWLLLYINPKTSCDANCEQKIYYLRQIRTATGKYSARLQRAVLTLSEHADPALGELLNKVYSGTLHFSTTSQRLRQFLGETGAAQLAAQQGLIYLIDPHGNVLMYYPLDTNPMGIFKDITRLLKLSNIG